MEESKLPKYVSSGFVFLVEVFCILAAAGFAFGYSIIRGDEASVSVGYAVIVVTGIVAAGGWNSRYESKDVPPEQYRKVILKFWASMFAGIVLAAVCTFLPVECWPFVPVFVLLSLLGGIVPGIVASAALLVIPALLTGQPVAFFVYLVGGTATVGFFCPIRPELKITLPLVASMSSLFVLETAGFIMPLNARPAWGMFLMPFLNLIISMIFLIGIVRFYFRVMLFKFRDKYLDINDTENPVLALLKKNDKEKYKRSIHITHFCEYIAVTLGYDVDAVKCAGYYHVFGEDVRNIMTEKKFPPEAVRVLKDYLETKKTPRGGVLKTREAAVLLCSETVITSIIQLYEKDKTKKYDYDKIIDTIFKRFDEFGMFKNCDITMRDLQTVQKIFKEEKLYYDFLR